MTDEQQKDGLTLNMMQSFGGGQTVTITNHRTSQTVEFDECEFEALTTMFAKIIAAKLEAPAFIEQMVRHFHDRYSLLKDF